MSAEVFIQTRAEAGARGFCRGCRQPILWLVTLNGKWMPMNDHATPTAIEGDVATYRASDSHWASCLSVDQFKRRKPSA